MKESFDQQPDRDPAILIQAELLKNHPDWIEMHAKDFRDLIDDNPEIIERYKDNPEEIVSEVEKKFYH